MAQLKDGVIEQCDATMVYPNMLLLSLVIFAQ